MLEEIQNFMSKVKAKIGDVYDSLLRGFIENLFSKPASILFLGIDYAGKTTLVNKLRNEANSALMPTRHPNNTTLEIGNLKAQIIDVGGHEAARVAWKNFFYNCDGIVFVVDVNDKERYPEVRRAYEGVRELEKNAPIAVLMNKIDLLHYNSSEEAENDETFVSYLQQETGIKNENLATGQPVHVSYVSITKENSNNLTGPLAQSFKWLEMMINRQKQQTSQ